MGWQQIARKIVAAHSLRGCRSRGPFSSRTSQSGRALPLGFRASVQRNTGWRQAST